tara:strand:- start:3494 stop:3976 length:483 start_codon:yes stop_codon:yes gene_type:complete
MSNYEMPEEVRKSPVAAREAVLYEKRIAEWLKANPSIGRLRGGKFYRIENDHRVIPVEPFAIFWTITAINPKYTKKVQRLYELDRQYSDVAVVHNEIWDDGNVDEDTPLGARLRSLDRALEKLWDKMDAIAKELPKRECQNFDACYKAIHGYTFVDLLIC